jgi:hypothetical protein
LETRFPQLRKYGIKLETMQDNYIDGWAGLELTFDGTPGESDHSLIWEVGGIGT